MKRFLRDSMLGIVIGLIVCLAVSQPGCAHTTNVVKDCSAEAAGGLIDDVNTALATDRYREGIAALVTKFGACVIEKAVLAVVDMATARARYDDFEALKLSRARTWLDERLKP